MFIKIFRAILIVVLVLIAGFWLSKYSMQPVQSALDDDVSGYAWSGNIGWISFNCTDRGICSTSDYGINIEQPGGNLTGYAWSESIGWIDFDPSAPYPAVPNKSVDYNSGTGKVIGWARAEARGDGWDGWILFGKNSGGWTEQVTINSGTGEFHGWAWGSDTVGWISFNCDDRPGNFCQTSDYKVATDMNFPPTVNCDDNETWDYCADSRNPFLSWNYFDPDGDSQESYQLQIDDDPSFSSPEIDTGVVDSSSNTYHPSGETLDWDITYRWRVKVKDDQGAWSDWSAPTCRFTTPEHAYPDSWFIWSPTNPSALEPVQFFDQTTFYNGGDSWSWTFETAVPASSILQNPVTTFSEPGNWEVVLEASDDLGTCPISRTVNVGFPLPDWEEVKPR